MFDNLAFSITFQRVSGYSECFSIHQINPSWAIGDHDQVTSNLNRWEYFSLLWVNSLDILHMKLAVFEIWFEEVILRIGEYDRFFFWGHEACPNTADKFLHWLLLLFLLELNTLGFSCQHKFVVEDEVEFVQVWFKHDTVAQFLAKVDLKLLLVYLNQLDIIVNDEEVELCSLYNHWTIWF